jgi:hypothetical protein
MDQATGIFTVKEGAPSTSGADDAPVYLVFEPYEKGHPSLAGKAFILDCKTGVSVDQAQDLARALKAKVRQVRLA